MDIPAGAGRREWPGRNDPGEAGWRMPRVRRGRCRGWWGHRVTAWNTSISACQLTPGPAKWAASAQGRSGWASRQARMVSRSRGARSSRSIGANITPSAPAAAAVAASISPGFPATMSTGMSVRGESGARSEVPRRRRRVSIAPGPPRAASSRTRSKERRRKTSSTWKALAIALAQNPASTRPSVRKADRSGSPLAISRWGRAVGWRLLIGIPSFVGEAPPSWESMAAGVCCVPESRV